MTIQLQRPLVFFDLETTGLDIATDRIVEISYQKLYPNGNAESKTIRINPLIPIPAATTKIHGITDEDVENCPTFKDLAPALAEVFRDADIVGYNSTNFDIPLLAEEFIRADVDIDWSKALFVDVMNIFMKKEPRNLKAAYRFYCDKDLENAHTASADTDATREVFEAQIAKYTDLPNSIEALSKFSSQGKHADLAGRLSYNDKHEVIFNFGKYKGQTVSSVLKKDMGYYGWLMNTDFPQYTKRIIQRIMLTGKA
ncbi:MAG: ribonuclease H-like domain-containing protein [Paludibacteraceae bacterium]|nr:ribonuclease H-like domain-containing protein [Paludibacteraceae bacterium]